MSEQDLRDKLSAAEAEAQAEAAREEAAQAEAQAGNETGETQAGSATDTATAEAAEPAGAEAEQAGAADAEPAEEAKVAEPVVDDSAAKYAELQQQYLRLQADFTNFRRRTQQEKDDLSSFVTVNLMKRLLPVLDNFERAEAAAQKTTDVQAVIAGMAGIQKQFAKVLQDVGVQEIEAQGKPFDPNFHEAVMRTQNPDLPDEAIDMVFEKGYALNGKVIRPSKVRVNSND